MTFSEKSDDSAQAAAQASAAGAPLLGVSAGASVDDSKISVKGIKYFKVSDLIGFITFA